MDIIASPVAAVTAQVPIVQTSSAITIDGNANESVWSSFHGTPVYRPISGGAAISGAADLSGNVRTLWDSQNLYFLIQVNDATRFTSTTSGSFWNGDGVELYLDIGNDSAGAYGSNDFQFVINAAGTINVSSGNAGTTGFGSGILTTFNASDFQASVSDSGST